MYYYYLYIYIYHIFIILNTNINNPSPVMSNFECNQDGVLHLNTTVSHRGQTTTKPRLTWT